MINKIFRLKSFVESSDIDIICSFHQLFFSSRIYYLNKPVVFVPIDIHSLKMSNTAANWSVSKLVIAPLKYFQPLQPYPPSPIS